MARLPFDTERPDSRPFIYGPRDWRSTPRIKLGRELERLIDDQLLDEISMIAANEISQAAEENLFRTFHYNMMSRKDFDNTDFEKVVQFICEYLELSLAHGNIRRIDDQLQRNVSTAVTLHCCKQIEEFPELLREGQQVHSSRVINSVQANAEKYLVIVDELEKYQNDDPRSNRDREIDQRRDRGRGRDEREDYDDRTRNFRDQYVGGSDRGRSERGSERYRDERGGRAVRQERVLSGREAMDEAENGGGDYRRTRNEPVGNRFVPLDRTGKPVESSRHIRHTNNDESASDTRVTADEPQLPRRRMTPSAQFLQEEVDTSYVAPRFAPVDTQPEVIMPSEPPPPPPPVPAQYVAAPPAPPPVYPETEEQKAVRREKLSQELSKPLDPEDDGHGYFHGPFGKHKILQRQKQSEMNINQHSVVYPVGSEIGDALIKEARKLIPLEAAVSDPNVTPSQISSSITIAEGIQFFDTLQSMVTEVSESSTDDLIEVSGENTDGARKIHRQYAVVANSIIGFTHLNDLQVPLNEAETLKDILSALRRGLKIVNERVPVAAAFGTDLRAAISRFDRLITREINVYCREVIKISSGNACSSAITHFDELLDQIQEHCTPEQTNAFLIFMGDLTSSIRTGLDPALGIRKGIFDMAVEPEEQKNRGIAFLPMPYLVTHLPFTAGELGFTNDETTVVTGNELSQFVKAALNVSDLDHPELGIPANILVTRDMSAFRVYQYPGRPDYLVLVPIPV